MDKREGAELKREEAIVEAVLFTMGKSVELRQLAAAIGKSEEEAKEAVSELSRRYDREKRGLRIIELSGSYQMCTRAEYYENLIRVAKAPKKQVLSDVVLETLSIIAYKQPITKIEIEQIRGVKSALSSTTLSMRWDVWTPRGGRHCLPLRRSFCAGSVWEAWRSCR